MSKVNTRRLEKELHARGLLPANCRRIDVSITPSSALVIRYEVYVEAETLGLYADAMKAAAVEQLADDERNRLARAAKGPGIVGEYSEQH